MASILGGLTFGPGRKLTGCPRYRCVVPHEKLMDWPGTFWAELPPNSFGSIRSIINFRPDLVSHPEIHKTDITSSWAAVFIPF